jgi:hypothetical protein
MSNRDPFYNLHENCPTGAALAKQLRNTIKANNPPPDTRPGRGVYPIIEGVWVEDDGHSYKVKVTRAGLRNVHRRHLRVGKTSFKTALGSVFTITRIQRNQQSKELCNV